MGQKRSGATESDDNPRTQPPPPVSPPGNDFRVVGVGSSAGGIEALEGVLRTLSPDAHLALVVIQHRAKGSGGDLLPSLLQQYASIPVVPIGDATTLEPGRVYVAPAETLLAVHEGKLIPLGRQKPRDMPIDFFLRSLATSVGERAVAVILSGSNTDGTLGAKDIRGHAGVVIAQDPETAGFPTMPTSVIDAGLADRVLTPGRIGEALADDVPRLEARPGRGAADPFPEEDREELLALLKRITGSDFTRYKANTIVRRIARRMALHRIERPKDYIEFVQATPEEPQALCQDLLIGVTRFFRDPEAFEAVGELLSRECLPNLRGDAVRAWVAGCSTGEEAYSVAILLREAIEKTRLRLDLKVYATDLDARSIALARTGVYPENIAADVSERRLARFLQKEGTGYRVRQEVRESVVFAVQNVIDDPPFPGLDLLCCRNLLMYLREEAQASVLRKFAFGLKPGGLLFLGPAETPRPIDHAFEEKNRKLRIYRRTPEAAAGEFLSHPAVRQPGALPARPAREPESPSARVGLGLPARAERFLLEACTPPSVLVDRFGTIRYVHGHTGSFLEPAPGEAALNVLGMARQGLQPDLSLAFGEAISARDHVVRRSVRVHTNERLQAVDLYVRPMHTPEAAEPFFMISFVEVGPAVREQPPPPSSDPGSASEGGADARVDLFPEDHEGLRESFRALAQQYETANEELYAANEELHASNEELLAANEELETGREELHAMNEEQVSLNAELEQKVEELSEIRDDMDNLLASTNVATLFLDSALRIKRFTPAIQGIMNLLPGDIGRDVGHLVLHLKYQRLAEDAAEVLRTLNTCSREVEGAHGEWFQMRIMPYRTRSNVIAGVVVTFNDATELKRSERTARIAQGLAEGMVDAISEAILILDGDLRVESANPAFYAEFRVTREETEGVSLYALGNRQWDIPRLRQLLEEVIPRRGEVSGFEVEHAFPHIGPRKMLVSARRIMVEDAPPKILVVFRQVGQA